jgi:cytochrome c5
VSESQRLYSMPGSLRSAENASAERAEASPPLHLEGHRTAALIEVIARAEQANDGRPVMRSNAHTCHSLERSRESAWNLRGLMS